MGKWLVALLLLLLVSLTAVPAGAARFVDVGTDMGLPTAIAAAWGDYDDDGYPDLYLGAMWGIHRASLLHNNGNGTFTDVTAAMGIRLDSASWDDWGAAWGDFNNDGKLDLLVVGNQPVALYRNDGDHFTEVAAAAGITSHGVGRGVAWADYDGDNALDVYLAYGEWDTGHLFHNNGDGTFGDATTSAGLSAASSLQGAGWADYNNDGFLDLLVTSRYGNSGLYRNNGDGTFTEVGSAADIGPAAYAAGVAWADYDNDRNLDAFVSGTPPWLFHNDGDGTFTDVLTAAGMSETGLVGYGAAWGDYDNDGYLDLATAQAGVLQTPFLWHGSAAGTFTNAAAAEGMLSSRHYVATAWADYLREGRVSLLASENFEGANSCLYHNRGNTGDGKWLRVRPVTSATGDATDGSPVRDATGARVEVDLDNDLSFLPGRTLTRLIDGGYSLCGQGEPVAQFGLGDATTVAVRVVFPDHSIVTRTGVAANQQIEIRDRYQALGAIAGTVTDARNGNPVIGGEVTCSYMVSLTNVSGVYRLPVVPTGTYSVTATGPGFATVTVDGVVVTADTTTTVDFALPLAPGTIQGVVKGSDTDAPIAGATVTCADEAVTTGADGGYSFTLDPGTYEVSASAPGYQSATVADVVVTSGETTTLDLSLLRVTGTLAGQVVNALTDVGVAGATVQSGSATTVTDGTGQYQLLLLPGTDLSVTVTADGYYSRSLDGITVTGGETTSLDIALTPRTGTITYRVKAFIDSRDDLVIQGSSLKWHHIDGAAPGLWSGHNEATTISSTLNGTTVMDDVAWMPVWPNPYPDENRFETDSSTFTSLAPPLPGIAMTAAILAADGPMPVTIAQAPTDANEYTLKVHFQDDVPDANWYEVQIGITYQGPFTDVATDHWAGDEIAACVAAGVVQGYWDGSYRPGLSVTRDQMAVYIARALAGGDGNVHVPTGVTEPSFTDVSEGHWAYKYVECCAGLGIVQGYWNNTYHPGEVVNRGQMAVYIARSVATPVGDAGVPGVPAGTPPTFPDVTADNDWSWCYKHVEYVADLGIVQGYWDEKYHPERDVTRDQMAVYVARAFELSM